MWSMLWCRWAGRLQVSLLVLLMMPLAWRSGGGRPAQRGLRGGGADRPLRTGATDLLAGRYFTASYVNVAGTRHYLGYTPSSYKEGTAVPLVVALHGCSQSAETFRQQTKFDKFAETMKFIVVFPEQPLTANPMGCWNWFNASDMRRGSGEPSMIAGITESVQKHYSVDRQRTFVAGFSAGGAMAAVMGATYPDRYAAIGVGSGVQYGGSTLDPELAGRAAYEAMGSFARPMPALIFHGGRDDLVPVTNADKLVRQWQTTADLADDAALNGSVPAGPVTTVGDRSAGGQYYTVNRYDDAQGRELVQYWLVPDMGHAWSGGCSCTSYTDPAGPDETMAMYRFFASHPMTRASVAVSAMPSSG
jgi:poly(hydroxyalkanoate) depolymerase family esterase